MASPGGGIRMTTLRKPSPLLFGKESSQIVQEISVPAGTQNRNSSLYDAEILSQLEEFAYIYSGKGIDFVNNGNDQRTSTAARVFRSQRQLPASSTETRLTKPLPRPPVASLPLLPNKEVQEASDTGVIPIILQYQAPIPSQDLPSTEDPIDFLPTAEPRLLIEEEKGEETPPLKPDRANSSSNYTIPIPSSQQSSSDYTESRGTEGSSSSKKPRRLKKGRRRDRFEEWMKSNTPTNLSTSTLSRLKALFRPRSSLSLDPESEATRSPLSTAGSWIVKAGQKILAGSRSPRSSPSKRGGGGSDVLLPPSPPSSTETRRQATTPTDSDPSTNPSLHSHLLPPSTVPSSLSSSLTVIPHICTQPSPSPLGTLKPWQCTFCLEQLSDRAAWLDHEESHILQVCDNEGYDGAIEHDNDNWFYSCGFCSVLLKTWFERTEHIGDHYGEGTTMASWDPLASPYPMQRHDFSPVRGFPACWSLGTLLGAQRLGNEEDNGSV
ncbi:hypothetical protein FGG08_004544 [Glutinoglossum americanum]|uniref:C2H2-type domain-containing protein n=1 Tax=Glutinoglossum americanum TaxID=1670608 RepID=A0A9P8KZF4_9PEZI|nr:hypothetical protein FGG08_004544 [Glutinoglossum americanum]